ncbi:unnamed protein product, partial [Choristocarpus tenellus]
MLSRTFEKSFLGAEAVVWMCNVDIAGSPEEAVAIGQRLVELGLIDHVQEDHRW